MELIWPSDPPPLLNDFHKDQHPLFFPLAGDNLSALGIGQGTKCKGMDSKETMIDHADSDLNQFY